jgi:hypothetical protein
MRARQFGFGSFRSSSRLLLKRFSVPILRFIPFHKQTQLKSSTQSITSMVLVRLLPRWLRTAQRLKSRTGSGELGPAGPDHRMRVERGGSQWQMRQPSEGKIANTVLIRSLNAVIPTLNISLPPVPVRTASFADGAALAFDSPRPPAQRRGCFRRQHHMHR